VSACSRPRRFLRPVALLSAAALLTMPGSPASSAPADGTAVAPSGVAADRVDCVRPDAPAQARLGGTSAGARLNRVDDQPQYSLRQLRRIQRRLVQALDAETDGAGVAASGGIVFRIPVHVHVITGDVPGSPGRWKVRRQIRVLNDAYAGRQSEHAYATRFRFYIESYERVRNPRWQRAAYGEPAARELRRRLHRGGRDALNLYISAPASRSGAVLLGWATPPWKAARWPRLDGVTIHQGSMIGGSVSGYNRGDTAAHEVGHWLGLFHTFEGGCSPGNDRVADTPAEAGPSLQCDVGRDTCEAKGLDPVRNFMNYSYDRCMNRFTRGQATRMLQNWTVYRTP
jgi:hypothetical protein